LPKVKNVVVIGMFLDMVNVVDNTFEFPLLQNKFIVSFHWSLKNLFVSARDQKKTNLTLNLIVTLQRLLMLIWPSKVESSTSFRAFRIWTFSSTYDTSGPDASTFDPIPQLLFNISSAVIYDHLTWLIILNSGLAHLNIY
jgi:hypothetical protein